MDIEERIAKREDRIARVSYLLREDPVHVAKILDETALRMAPTIEKLRDYLALILADCGKAGKTKVYFWMVDEFKICWDALSLKEVQSAVSMSEIQTASSRARKENDEAKGLAILKMSALLEKEEKEEVKSDQA